MPIKHNFTSQVADAGDPDEVGPDEWNDDHDLSTHTRGEHSDATWEEIERHEVSAAETSHTFNFTGSNFHQLRILIPALFTVEASGNFLHLRFNGDSGGNYQWIQASMGTAGWTFNNDDPANEVDMGAVSDHSRFAEIIIRKEGTETTGVHFRKGGGTGTGVFVLGWGQHSDATDGLSSIEVFLDQGPGTREFGVGTVMILEGIRK